jgi:hypothetical protein
MNSELSENGKDTVVLDWFCPTESKTLRPVWWNYAWKGKVPSNGALGRLIWQRARVSIRGRWTLIGVGYRFRKVSFRDYREDPVILGPTSGAATVI